LSKPTILYLTHRVPHPPNRGDRIRTYNFLRYLAQRTNVWLGCLADEPVSDETRQVLGELCEKVAIVPVEPHLRWVRAGLSFALGRTISEGAFNSPELKATVRRWATEARFDSTLCSSSALTPYLRLTEFIPTGHHVDLIDVDSEKWFDYSQSSSAPKSWIYGLEARRMRRLESSLSEWMRGIAVVSEPEARLYRSFRPDGRIQAIPNGVDVDYFSPVSGRSANRNSEQTSGCVFVGALDYKPNVDGICWFAREIWPAILKQRPDETLKIVGREPVAEVRELNSLPGVEVVGTVPDVRPFLSDASVAVVPLRIARGVQNKVLEALAMAKAVVASPDPLVGLDVEDGTHLFTAREPDEWVARVLELLDDASLRGDMGLAAQAYVTANHRWEQCLASLNKFLGLDAESTSDRNFLAKHPQDKTAQQSSFHEERDDS
jgi:sugar transferase (PEP-CTERM/EpsH1 system associated)